MTVVTEYGFYYQGVYFVRSVSHHSERECSLANYFTDAVKEVFALYTRDEICDKLDAILVQLQFKGSDAIYPEVYKSYEYTVPDEPSNDTMNPRYDVTCDEIRQRAANTVHNPYTPSQLQKYYSRDAIAIQRFQDLFVHGHVMAFDEKNGLALTADGAPGANQDRESIYFDLSKYKSLYVPSVAYIIDLDKGQLYNMINWTYDLSKEGSTVFIDPGWFDWITNPRDKCIIKEYEKTVDADTGVVTCIGVLVPTMAPGARYPTPVYPGYCEQGAFYTLTPLSECIN